MSGDLVTYQKRTQEEGHCLSSSLLPSIGDCFDCPMKLPATRECSIAEHSSEEEQSRAGPLAKDNLAGENDEELELCRWNGDLLELRNNTAPDRVRVRYSGSVHFRGKTGGVGAVVRWLTRRSVE